MHVKYDLLAVEITFFISNTKKKVQLWESFILIFLIHQVKLHLQNFQQLFYFYCY